MKQNAVYIAKLQAAHQDAPFTDYRPLSSEMRRAVDVAVQRIFDEFGGGDMLKSSGDVYLKPNAIYEKPYVFTRVEVLESVIRYWQKVGARQVYVMENATASAYTRLVFLGNGYAAVCRATGAVPIYLDEDQPVVLQFEEDNPRGYDSNAFGTSKTVYEKLMLEKEHNLYINLPKLKTHSMGVVTLGIKNQWGFPVHADRDPDHNYNLHDKIVDVLEKIRPDFTLIEGVEGTIYGHYPVTKWADLCIRPFKVLLGGPNVVATDVVGAAILGYEAGEVPHIARAIERGLGQGVTSVADVELVGDITSPDRLDLLGEHEQYGGRYPFELPQILPDTVNVVKGSELACREGCVNNVLGTIQDKYYDHDGRGGFTVVMGKGFEAGAIDGIEGPVLVAGHCAIDEVGDRLTRRLGAEKVYTSGGCNDLRATNECVAHLMKIDPRKMTSVGALRAGAAVRKAIRNGSTARGVRPLAHKVKYR
jgi:uncharacterized protein (DUF362 family)